MANNQYQMFGKLPTLPQYRTPAPTSPFASMPQIPANAGLGGYDTLAAAAEKERLAQLQRSTDRQNTVVGGYDQQITNNRQMGDQGYDMLAGNFDQISKDANDTRTRNMARVDQYGNSARSDLNVRARQAMATASQSAIKRGLGNTTIASSAERGANFDNNRQKLALEDQLLQNRINTDTGLSAAYQGTLQNRATGLASQWNQNMANENSLTSQRLGYIGGIQEDMTGFNSVADLYSQKFGMQNQNEQNTLERDSRVLEADKDRSFKAGETKLERDARLSEANIDRSWKAGETKLERDARLLESNTGRTFQAGETKLERDSREKISNLDRTFQANESKLARETTISQAAMDRAFQGDQSLLQREAQKQEADIDRRWKEQQTKLDQAWQGKESASERESRKQEAELDRQWQQRNAESERNTKIEQARLDREQQTRESEKDRSLTAEQNEKNRIADDDPRYGQPKRTYNLGGFQSGGLYARPNAIPYDGVIGGY
jgi:hypothetical protein